MTPKQILERLIDSACSFFQNSYWSKGKRGRTPGALVESLSAEDREILKGLTSDDAANYFNRLHKEIGCEEYFEKQQPDYYQRELSRWKRETHKEEVKELLRKDRLEAFE